ncbi:MAG: hypothetical protein OQK93_07935 [Gammaproteobacteria bacterium]|jgi:hypothetical protein|nr:hypothetical protein [Gammaproteobacteria bacterium]
MPPYTRHNEVLILDRRPGNVDANYFNQAQTALKRIGQQIRLKIPTLNHLDLIVQQDAWIIVDRVLNDIPVVAWTDFQTEGRNNLHEPIACEIRLYHFAARMVLKTTLDAMEDILGQSLAEQDSDKPEKVLPFKKDDNPA